MYRGVRLSSDRLHADPGRGTRTIDRKPEIGIARSCASQLREEKKMKQWPATKKGRENPLKNRSLKKRGGRGGSRGSVKEFAFDNVTSV